MALNKKMLKEEDTSRDTSPEADSAADSSRKKVKFEVFGEEMLEKGVKLSGNSGRVYLPPDWVGHKVKVIRID